MQQSPYSAQQNDYLSSPTQEVVMPVPQSQRNWGTLSLIMSIVGLVGMLLAFVGVLPIVMGILGIVFGRRGQKIDKSDGNALAGIIIGILDVVIGAVTLVLLIVFCAALVYTFDNCANGYSTYYY